MALTKADKQWIEKTISKKVHQTARGLDIDYLANAVREGLSSGPPVPLTKEVWATIEKEAKKRSAKLRKHVTATKR